MIYSGLAAGILISFSVLGEAILRLNLPDTRSRYLIENLCYSFGFLLVILGRMQFFAENTITTILPLVGHPSLKTLAQVTLLWSIVHLANVAGAGVAASFMAFSGTFNPDMLAMLRDLSEHATGFGTQEAVLLA